MINCYRKILFRSLLNHRHKITTKCNQHSLHKISCIHGNGKPSSVFMDNCNFSTSVCKHNKKSINNDEEVSSAKSDEGKDNSEHDAIEDIKKEILDQALDHVHKFGWSRKAISAGAEEAGYAGVAEGMFVGEGAELVMHFIKQSNASLLQYLDDLVKMQKENDENIKTSEFIRRALEFRLRLIIPYINVWSEAMTLLLSPKMLSDSTDELTKMVDDIWYYAGDKSTDINWYTKRGMLAKLYGSAQLVMLTDQSPDFKDTWEFLDRRIEDLENFGKVSRNIKQGGEAVMDAVFSGTSVLRNVAGFPSKKR